MTTAQPQAPAPTRWRDPVLVVAVVSALVATVAAFYSYKQTTVSREQLEHEELIAQHRALGVGVRIMGDLERALERCLRTAATVEACSTVLTALEGDVHQAALDPEVATYYPEIHGDLENLYFDVRTGSVSEVLHTMESVPPHLDRALKDLNQFDFEPGMWLAHGDADLQAEAIIVKRFGAPTDAGVVAP